MVERKRWVGKGPRSREINDTVASVSLSHNPQKSDSGPVFPTPKPAIMGSPDRLILPDQTGSHQQYQVY